MQCWRGFQAVHFFKSNRGKGFNGWRLPFLCVIFAKRAADKNGFRFFTGQTEKTVFRSQRIEKQTFNFFALFLAHFQFKLRLNYPKSVKIN